MTLDQERKNGELFRSLLTKLQNVMTGVEIQFLLVLLVDTQKLRDLVDEETCRMVEDLIDPPTRSS